MSESKLSPLCSLLPRLSIVEREGGKPKVNRAQNDARISSAEVRRKKTMSTSVATRHSQSELCSVLDLRTGLYSQSTAYVYSILETEILTGKLG